MAETQRRFSSNPQASICVILVMKDIAERYKAELSARLRNRKSRKQPKKNHRVR